MCRTGESTEEVIPKFDPRLKNGPLIGLGVRLGHVSYRVSFRHRMGIVRIPYTGHQEEDKLKSLELYNLVRVISSAEEGRYLNNFLDRLRVAAPSWVDEPVYYHLNIIGAGPAFRLHPTAEPAVEVLQSDFSPSDTVDIGDQLILLWLLQHSKGRIPRNVRIRALETVLNPSLVQGEDPKDWQWSYGHHGEKVLVRRSGKVITLSRQISVSGGRLSICRKEEKISPEDYELWELACKIYQG